MDEHDELARARERLDILEAVVIALERRVELMDLVADSSSTDEAVRRLQSEWDLTQVQATAALDLQVSLFATLERSRIKEERDKILGRIDQLTQ